MNSALIYRYSEVAMAKKRKKTTAEMKKIKNMVMERLADPGKDKSEIAQEIGRRPPYMYTTLCPDPRYRSGSGRLSIVTK